MKLDFDFKSIFNEEQEDWVKLTPRQRYIESCKLWSTYLALGGSLDPEPDSQSPFDFPELQRSVSSHEIKQNLSFFKKSTKKRKRTVNTGCH